MMSKSMWRLGAVCIGTAVGVAGCADRQGVTELPNGPNFLVQSEVVPGQVTLCKYSVNLPGLFVPGADFTVSATGGQLPAGTSFHLNSVTDLNVTSDCAVVWRATDATTQTVTIEEAATGGVQLEMIVGFKNIGDIIWLDNPPNPYSIDVSDQVGATLFFKNIPGTPPPPPCVGLTPGYWKNWRNHYTDAQFASLLVGTIASSIAQADAIFASLGAKASDPITKLKWFVLANQLTLSLMGSDLPNPSGGDLTEDCVATVGGTTLGDALSMALAMLANPTGYTSEQILAVKDILDAIANLGGG